jgi:DNA repair protein RAD5
LKGTSPVKEGDTITIVRDNVYNSSNKIVRFAVNNREVGRLPREVASYISTLLDLKLCVFEGTLVWCPPILKIGEDMILTIKCYILPNAIHTNSFLASVTPQAKKRSFDRSIQDPSILRKLALIQMFRNLGMRPVRSSIQRMNVGGENSWDMILQSVTRKVEEQEDDEAVDPNSEEKKEVSDGQLDTIYEKAQVFDSQIKPMDQPITMSLELKEYQKRVNYLDFH